MSTLRTCRKWDKIIWTTLFQVTFFCFDAVVKEVAHILCARHVTLNENALLLQIRLLWKMRARKFFAFAGSEGTRFMICCDQCGEWFHVDCIGITEEEGNRMAKDDEPYICHQCEHPVHHEPQVDLLVPKWHPGGPSFDFFPYPTSDVTRPWGSDCNSCGSNCTGH